MGPQLALPSVRQPGKLSRSGRRACRAPTALLAGLPLLFLAAQARAGDLADSIGGAAGEGVLDLPSPKAARPVPPGLRRLDFVENRGQWDTPAAFVAVQGRTVLQAVASGFVVDALPAGSEASVQLRFSFEGARAGVEPVGVQPLPGVRNYLEGNDPERWVAGARSFEHVVYQGLYEGVDVRLRDADGTPEYDLLLAPGADLTQVALRCAGISALEVDAHGGLLMHSAQGVLRQSPPRTWCMLPSGETEPIECAFVLLDETRYGFRLAEHAPDLPVVVDPGLEWATYLGGSGDDWLFGVARMSNGNVVAAGFTSSPDFPIGLVTFGAYDAFVAVLDATGSSLVASTLLGGSGQDFGLDVKLGPQDEVFVLGATTSIDLPTTGGPFQPSFAGGSFDGFVAELDPTSLLPVYSTFLGGSDFDLGSSLHVRAPRVLTVAGSTRSPDFPVTAGAVQGGFAGGNTDYFLCRLDLDRPPASQLLYGTYLGGSGQEGISSPGTSVTSLKAIRLHEDASGVVTLAGRTESPDIPTRNAVMGYDGGVDAYLAIVDPAVPGLGGLVYATHIGGSSGMNEAARALAVAPDGVITLGGWTYSPDFPTTPGACGTTFVGPQDRNDAFLLRLDPTQPPASQLLYSTLLAGDGYEGVYDLALTSDGRIVAQGFTGDDALTANSFPTTCSGFQPDFAGLRDGFLLYLDPAGNGVSDLLYSTFLGGPGWNALTFGLSILSESPTLKVLGGGGSGTLPFPVTANAFQKLPGGVNDGILYQAEINPYSYCDAAPNSYSADGALVCGSGSVAIADNTFTLEVSGGSPNDFGLFFYGNAAAQVPFYNGTRCVGGSGVFRLLPVVKIDASGHASRLLDFTQPPAGSGPGTILPGSTWYFQFWYRDPNGGGKGANLSNGLKATFYP